MFSLTYKVFFEYCTVEYLEYTQEKVCSITVMKIKIARYHIPNIAVCAKRKTTG